jgi:hypothetical protein
LVALSRGFVAEPITNVVALGAANIPVLKPIRGSGFLHLGVKYHQRNRTTNLTTAKRQSYDFLRNDISGYSVQSKFGQKYSLVASSNMMQSESENLHNFLKSI